MKPEPLDDSKAATAKSASLERVLRRSRKIRAAIKEAAGRLASATVVLKQRKKANSSPRSVDRAIAEYELVEGDVANAAHDLTEVNTDLAVEVAERVGIESELADMKVDLATAHDDLAQSQENEQEALHRALHDELTGLPNKALFDQSLDQELLQARRHGRRLAVLFFDIDDFKNINDSHGHQVGDEVLLMIAERLRSFVRAEDIVTRWGGDEFACLLLEVGPDAEVARLACDMIDCIAEEFEAGGTTLFLRCSVGIALYPGDGESADILLKNADTAMYRAKGAPERVVLFGSEPLAAGGNTQTVEVSAG